MAVDLMGSVNKVVNSAVTQLVTDEVPKKMGGVVNSLVNAAFDALDAGLKQIQEITKEETTPSP